MYNITISTKNNFLTDPWITFIPSPASVALTARGNKEKLEPLVSYRLNSIGNTISMGPTEWNGNLYISDQKLVLPKNSSGMPTPPAYTNTEDKTRYQILEFAGNSSCANIDITYINWFSFAIMLEDNNGNTRGVPKQNFNSDLLLKRLALLSGNSSTTVVTNETGIVRVISPNAGLPKWVNKYPSFRDYIMHIFVDNVYSINIDNDYSGVQDPPSDDYKPQHYSVTDISYNGLDLVITGSTSVMGSFTMAVQMIVDTFSNDTYLAVLKYSWHTDSGSNPNGNTGDNNVFSAVSRDLLAGFSYGFIGSKEFEGKTSAEWQDATDSQLFGDIQPDNRNYYNQWAGIMHSCFSDVYTFPFNDFLTQSPPCIAIDNAGSVDVHILE